MKIIYISVLLFLFESADLLALALQNLKPPVPQPQLRRLECSETQSFTRRAAIWTFGISGLGAALLTPSSVWARAPGSKDITEAIQQIQDASVDLQKLQRDFDKYAVIDNEGRAVTDATVGARRILGGVAPLAGDSAIEVAKATPLYRIDGAFNLIRKACLEGDDDSWGPGLDLVTFEEIAERILFELQKADGDFYSVQFASKGTKQIRGIFNEAKIQIDRGVVDFDAMLSLLAGSKAPGL